MAKQSEPFDIAVLGAGPGGYIAALKAAQMGARVACVEKHYLGGTCLNYGCIPSKALLASAQLKHDLDHADAWGLELAGPTKVAWDRIQARKDKVVQTLRGGIGSLFKARKVQLFEGTGKLAGPGTIEVTADGGKPQTLQAGKIILAVGSEPVRIPGWPDDAGKVCTSDEALHWDSLPASLLIVGGGVIGCEFACMMQALGVQVTVVEMLPELLPGIDVEIGQALRKIFTKRNIDVHTGTKVETLDESSAGLTATLSDGQTIESERVLVSVGRRPATAEIGLETVGLETDRGFIRVDDSMRTAARDIYCIGDANGRCLLAHAASGHAITAVEHAMGHDVTFSRAVPNAVYTFPEIASAGITAEQAAAAKLPVAVGTFPIGHLGKAMAAGHTEGFCKVIRHRETGQLLGVHMIGHNVTESIAAAVGMLDAKVAVADVAEAVIAHPTITESLKEAAEDALWQALHLPPRKMPRLTVQPE